MTKLLFLLSILCVPSYGMKCTAKVANRTYQVSLDKTTLFIDIKTDNGFTYAGATTYRYTSILGAFCYHLPYTYGQALELRLEDGGKERINLCLTPNECYACKE